MAFSVNRSTVVLALISAVVIASGFAFSPSSTPEQQGDENNLKVLPKDISHDELMQVMHSFEVALGYNCGDCHARSTTDPQKLDFAADTKNKQTATDMMKMVQEINGTYFGVKGEFKDNYLASTFNVTCNTCHGGHEKPLNTVTVPIPRPRK